MTLSSSIHVAANSIISFFLMAESSTVGSPGGSMVKNLPANEGNAGSITGSGRFPGEGNGYPLQYSFLENSMDRGAYV